jgi:hypothetical protein
MRLWLAWLIVGLVARPAQAQGLPTDLEPESLMTTPVVLMNGGRAVSQGTGFFFASTTLDGKPDTVFLVTNYHVLTGRAPLASGPRLGDRIRFILHESTTELARVRQIELPLYDERGSPMWVTSDAVPNADVVLVPLPPGTYANIGLYVFTEAFTQGDIKIRPTSGATLLGYPYGFYDESHFLPVWKTGHVASEPTVDFDDLPTFLVDVSAFPGMSGSPVLAFANGVYESEDGSMRSGRVLKLLGIFSAMPVVREHKAVDASNPADTQTTEISLQLGYVWKAALIADMAKSYRPKR